MMKTKNALIIVALMLLCFVGYAKKSHTNNFWIKGRGDVSSILFKWSGYLNVCHGQPWTNTVDHESSGTQVKITVNCGRHGSGAVADDFNSRCEDNANKAWGTYTQSWTKLPSSLNFMFTGTITVIMKDGTQKIGDVVIGQGHASRNNWWIGGTEVNGATLLGLGLYSDVSGETGSTDTCYLGGSK